MNMIDPVREIIRRNGGAADYDAATDRADLDAAEGALNALGDAIGTAQSAIQTAAIKSPAVAQLLRPIAPALTKLTTAQTGVAAALKPLGERVTVRETCQGIQYADYKGAFSAKERQGTFRSTVPIFARLKFASGPLGDTFESTGVTNGFEVFNRGRKDSASQYGYAAGSSVNDFITNLLEGGEVKSGHLFEGFGLGFRAVCIDGSPMDRADLEVLGAGRVRLSSENDKRIVELPRIAECPALHDVREAQGANGAATGAYWSGPAYMQDTPILRLRPKERGHALRLEWEDPDAELSKAIYLFCYLYGEHLQNPGNR